MSLEKDTENSLFEETALFALKAHHGAKRKGTAVPYILHPFEAAVIAASITDDEEVQAAAMLHDVVEDTPYTIDDIREKFGERVAALVSSDTEDKMKSLPPEETWFARKKATIDKLKYLTREEKIIVLSDKLSNIRACRKEQLEIGDKLWERFHEKNKKSHEWYYVSILKELEELSDTFAYGEYKRLVEQVFDIKQKRD